LENTGENCEMIWKIWKQFVKRFEKIQKKGKLNSEKMGENMEER
jgi:hypothetical protein